MPVPAGSRLQTSVGRTLVEQLVDDTTATGGCRGRLEPMLQSTAHRGAGLEHDPSLAFDVRDQRLVRTDLSRVRLRS